MNNTVIKSSTIFVLEVIVSPVIKGVLHVFETILTTKMNAVIECLQGL